jgi:hypothetical protein
MTANDGGQPKLTRYTTPAERANIAGIQLDDADVSHFMDLINKGLVTAAAAADGAVQEDMGLSAEVTVRLSRAVRADDGTVEELVGREVVEGRIKARKVFKDPEKAPVVD